MPRYPKAQIGEIRTRSNKGRLSQYRKTADGWIYVPSGEPLFGNGKIDRSTIKRSQAGQVPTGKAKAAGGAKGASMRYKKNSEKPPNERKTIFRTDCNPETVKVKATPKNVKWVKVDGRTWKLIEQAA